jgi:hypothetical protein
MMRKKSTGTLYRIVVRSELGDRYASAFEGMHIETKDGDTILTAEIIDQPQLHGILDRIRSLALERVMNLGKNRIEMRITRSSWFLRDLRFPHS